MAGERMHRESAQASSAEEMDELVSRARAQRRRIDAVDGQLHIANHIPRGERIANTLMSLGLLACSLHAALHDDLHISGRRGPGIHLHGPPLWMLCAAMACAAANMLSVVVDHYDTRANEFRYRRFALVTQVAGWLLFFAAFAAEAFVFQLATRH
ncbi:hypothetical protein NYO99_03090 [Pelomonas sp. UHG3]|jgi:hypothetical protein|uniref:Uncharacterized protein n=1 Tax=Roseateles hydrophilus TaxID=2975054 RepID=A0ACC6C6D0_9BURK|nr:hypothetical protein [Pelomonas sp. UHG3]MCY4743950.1 hypothetical protein [Pelomonas sp. UHG3]